MSMKINILSPGRSHLSDLARELHNNGFDVKFYSFVPTKRLTKFGLPRCCSTSLFLPLLPFIVLCRLLSNKKTASLLRKAQDFLMSVVMRKTDVTIAWSGDFNKSLDKAKRRGDIVIVERGCKHILEQKRILESIPANKGKVIINDANAERELHDYRVADYVSVASRHVVDSFQKQNYPMEKLFLNPYGVNVSMFYPDDTVEKKYDAIMVGNWCYRKGCDMIVDAIRNLGYKLLHVGSITDCPFPQNDESFTHVDSVQEYNLVNYYHQAKIFVMPSREDGFGMVYSQALACNLPIVGSIDSGAPEIKCRVAMPQCVIIIDDYTTKSVMKGIKEAMSQYEMLQGVQYAGNAIGDLTWDAYGRRYSEWLHTILSKKGINEGNI